MPSFPCVEWQNCSLAKILSAPPSQNPNGHNNPDIDIGATSGRCSYILIIGGFGVVIGWLLLLVAKLRIGEIYLGRIHFDIVFVIHDVMDM
jgi:hypothetical protein